MRQVHKAGEKLFVDWAGDTLAYADAGSGEVRDAHLFLAVLGASNYTYAEACADQATESFLTAHVHAFEFFGGAPELVVPDNLKTGVARADRYEAEIYAPYAELAAHYGAVVMPARAGKPRDKAKVETGVLIAEREILAPLAQAHLLQPRGGQHGDRGPASGAQRAALRQAPRQSARASLPSARRRSCGPCRASPSATARARWRRVHIDYHVELCRPLLLGALPPRARAGRAALRCPHRGGLPPRLSASLCTCAARPGAREHPGRAHAGRAPRGGLLDAGAHRGLGGQDGAGDGRAL